MRLVRLLTLTLIVAAVYFAQLLVHTTSLTDFLPAWLVALAPGLARVPARLPADHIGLAQWLTLLGLLSFGLITPWWHGEHGRAYRRLPPGDAQLRPWWWAAQVTLILALMAAVALLLLPERATPNVVLGVWGAALGVYLLAGGLASRVRPPVVYSDLYLEVVRPWSGWPLLLVLLVLLGAFYGFQLVDLPLRVDELTATTSLAAQAWVDGQTPPLAATPTAGPLPTLVVSAFFHRLVEDNLLAARLAGLAAAAGLIAAVWLMATELFRRTPVYGHFGEVLEDDGRWIALLAVLALGVLLPMLHFARVPLVLEGVTWGTLGLWALLVGLRRDRPLLLGVSALLLGWAVYYGPVGLLMVVVALLVWWGVLLLQRDWLTGKDLAEPQRREPVCVQRGAGWRGFGYWLAGLIVGCAPLVAFWTRTPGAWAAQWTWFPAPAIAPTSDGIWPQVQTTLAGLNMLADAAGFVPYPSQFVAPLLAPLLALAMGALLLSFDTLTGWTLVAWLGTGVVGVALTAPVHPDWLALTLLLPPIALALAFVLDRLRLLIMQTAGTWSLQATVYLAMGVLIAAGFYSWVEFYGMGQREIDLASAVGRVLAASGDAPVVMVQGQVELGTLLDDPVVQMLAGERGDLTRVQYLSPISWPPIPPGTRVLLAADHSTLPEALDAAYPGGQMTILRDLRANPILYIYDVGAYSHQPAGLEAGQMTP